ncbi:translocation/assembly module TamB domain-containing protein [Desulfogranum mediterraneum]|uniref:translocation/assembly module TamB domain-containing protein n=1 Tax=Desulfogranum mediterraneum TaxID=160661 RepID=UPI0004011E36|nr:translocation/assembly module TamB domain-containing protein [Desulfogranum mediterraneum]
MRAILRPALVALLLLTSLIVLCCGYLSLSTSGLSTLLHLGELLLPGRLVVDQVQGSLLTGARLSGLSYTDQNQSIRTADLELLLDPSQLLRRRLTISRLELGRVQYRESPPAAESSASLPGPLPRISLPLELEIRTGQLEGLEILAADGSSRLNLGPVQLNKTLFRETSLSIGSLQLQQERLRLNLRGRLTTRGDYPLALELDYRLQPPGWEELAGRAHLEGPLFRPSLQAVLEQPFQAELEARFELDAPSPQWQFRAHSRRVCLALLQQAWPEIALDELRLHGSGNLERTGLSLSGEIAPPTPPHRPPASLQAELELKTTGLTLRQLQLRQGKSLLQGSGALSWQERLSWQADISASSIDPGQWYPRWPGALELETLSIQGGLQPLDGQDGQTIRTTISLNGLQGRLRGYPVQARGSAQLDGATLELRDLQLSSGAARLALQGVWGPKPALQFRLTAPRLEELWPGLSGSGNGQGSIQGNQARPTLITSMEAAGLHWQQLELATVSLQARTGFTSDSPLALHLEAEGLKVQGQDLDQLQLKAAGTLSQPRIQARLKAGETELSLSLNGEKNSQGWQGSLQELQLQGLSRAEWRLDQPAALHWQPGAKGGFSLEQGCLGSDLEDKLCLSGSYGPSRSWTMAATIPGLSLDSLHPLFPQALVLEGDIRGSLTLDGRGEELQQGRLRLKLERGAFQPPAEIITTELELLHQLQAQLSADYGRGLLQASGKLLLADQGRLNSSLKMSLDQATAAGFKNARLDGRLVLGFRDISVINPLIQEYGRIQGALNGVLAIGGSAREPELRGHLDLEQGQGRIFPLGISLDPLSARAELADKQLSLLATAGSGPGSITISSTPLPPGQALETLHLRVEGKDFELINTDELQALVTPELEIMVDRREAVINGTITFPQAEISSGEEDGVIHPSADVRVVDEPGKEESSPWALRSDITLRAGEEVRINAKGLRGQLQGELQIENSRGALPTGSGSLLIRQGGFSLYGKRLDIDLGRLIYSGGPLDDPGLEIRTEKRQDGVTAGVEIGGFLSAPEIHFYSSPPMEQYEIIQRLLNGSNEPGEGTDTSGVVSDLAERVGFGAVNRVVQRSKELLHIDNIQLSPDPGLESVSLIIGSWLTPRFYISYGRNLLDDSASFFTRYSLGKGFYLKTETGNAQSSGDISYEFEQ